MKKTTRIAAIVICMILMLQIPAFAANGGNASVAGTAAVATALLVEDMYESSVIVRMADRAGASTATGAKGIAFEVICSDIQNIFCNLKAGLKTTLSKNSADAVADLVTTNKKGDVIQLIQCKDGTSKSQVEKVINQVRSGKYADAKLIGTKEFTASFNEKVAKEGLSQFCTDSKVSTKLTSKIADKALGIKPSVAQTFNSIAKPTGITAAIAATVSLAESMYRGDDVYTATGSVVEDTTVSAVSVAIAAVTSAELPAILTAIGASAAIANVAAGIVAFVIPVAGGYALYILADECQFEERVADVLEETVTVLSSVYANIEAKIIDFDIPQRTSGALTIVKDTSAEVKESVLSVGRAACNTAAEVTSNIATSVVSWFK